MSDIKTYPEMNQIIVDLLRGSGEAKQLYAAARIEELEQKVSKLDATLTRAITELSPQVDCDELGLAGCGDYPKHEDDCIDCLRKYFTEATKP